ncbi:MAG: phosphoribosylamine--glycine ligase [Bacillota bacterium]
MRILVIGSGGREHALAWAIDRSPGVEKLWIAPGNPGTEGLGINISLDPRDCESIGEFCLKESIDLVVVGPENPLAAGIADFLWEKGISTFGPVKAGANLEASKSAAKDFMSRHSIPHPQYVVFKASEDAVNYVRSTPGPWVIKADGLAFGKGVTITGEIHEAIDMINELLSGRLYGQAGKQIVIEEFLEGVEATAMALCDGNSICPLPMAKDHKRVFDGDKGPMTGGMGAYSPLPFLSREMENQICQDILHRTFLGLKKDGIDYRGVIYAGLMITKTGPKVLEYNVRFGDPEAQCVLPRLSGSVAGLLMACAKGDLQEFLSENEIGVRNEASVTVVMASKGYPGKYDKGSRIEGLFPAEAVSQGDIVVFHAGTGKDEEGHLVNSGGRVLGVTALGATIDEARARAYEAVQEIKFPGAYYRKDIGKSLVAEDCQGLR